MLFIFKYWYIYHLLFSKVNVCILLNISVKNHEKIFCHKDFQGYMFICQNSEGVHPYLLKCCRGTCSFAGMLKGYMVRKRLGTPGSIWIPALWGHIYNHNLFHETDGFTQNRRQKVVNRGKLRGLAFVQRGAWYLKLTKVALIYNISYFNFGGRVAIFGGISPPKPPVATGLVSLHNQRLAACLRFCVGSFR